MEVFFRSPCCRFTASLLLLGFTVVSSQDESITIQLNKTITQNNRELYGDFFIIKNNSTLQVNLEANYNKTVSFIVFQVHSHLCNISLSNKEGSHVHGTNIGLYSPIKPLDSYTILNSNTKDLKLYLTVHGYRKTDPIPGGCNIDLPVEVSPFMLLSYDKSLVHIAAPPPQDVIVNPLCNMIEGQTGTAMSFYKLFLPEKDFDEMTYFDGLRKMFTLDAIMEHGNEIPKPHLPRRTMAEIRRYLATYSGTGSVYVAVAYKTGNPEMYSIYVPTHTYGCSPGEGSCNVWDDVLSQLFCAVLLFIGLFTCYFGHRFFKTEMFLVGMFAGVTVSFILISIIRPNIHQSVVLGGSLMSGIFFGAIWLLFWWFYGIPILAVFLSTMHLGFMLSSIVYFLTPPGHAIIEDDSTFWTIFVTLMIVTSLTLITTTFLSNLFCCATLGAYAAVFAIDHYIGSNLKYIVINTLRRAVVDNFSFADLSPPYQFRDAISTLLWIVLSVSGFLFQHYHNRGRPPFPPPPRSISPRMPDYLVQSNYGSIGNRTRRLLTIERGTEIAGERAPLLSNEVTASRLVL